jgi:hypothetical protein
MAAKSTKAQRRHIGHHVTCAVMIAYRAPNGARRKYPEHSAVTVRIPAKVALTERGIVTIAKDKFRRDFRAGTIIEKATITNCVTSRANRKVY